MANQIFTIKPYKWEGLWVFDDPATGLVKEALVDGMPEMISTATKMAGIDNPENGFLALFSKDPFPGSNIELIWACEKSGGNIYKWNGQEGWLCPALFKYFHVPPEKMYVQVRSVEKPSRGFAQAYADELALGYFEDTEINRKLALAMWAAGSK